MVLTAIVFEPPRCPFERQIQPNDIFPMTHMSGEFYILLFTIPNTIFVHLSTFVLPYQQTQSWVFLYAGGLSNVNSFLMTFFDKKCIGYKKAPFVQFQWTIHYAGDHVCEFEHIGDIWCFLVSMKMITNAFNTIASSTRLRQKVVYKLLTIIFMCFSK